MSNYLWNILYHFDIFINQLFPGAREHETISSRWGRTDRVWLYKYGSKMLDVIDRKGHCRTARIRYELMHAIAEKAINREL